MIPGLSDGPADPLTDDPFYATLVERSRRTNTRRTHELLHLVANPRQVGEVGVDERERLAELAHQIVGSAGTFGFARVSERGRELEQVLVDAGDSGPVAVTELERLGRAMLADLTGG